MDTWYKGKMNFHHKEMELAKAADKSKAAEYHLNEYLNYKQLHATYKNRCGG